MSARPRDGQSAHHDLHCIWHFGQPTEESISQIYLTFLSSLLPLLSSFSQLADRPSSHSSVSTHVRASFKEGVRRLRSSLFSKPRSLAHFLCLCLSLERCQFASTVHDEGGADRRRETGSVRDRHSPL